MNTIQYKPKILAALLFILVSTYILTRLLTPEAVLNITLNHENLRHNTNEIEKYRYMRKLEFKYREKLESLTPEDIKSLSEYYHRDITIHWSGNHGLLPASKPLRDIKCLELLDKMHNVSVTVIISYKNELLFLLYRTLTTIVERTPSNLLLEIILIDDGSDTDDSEEISEYCSVVGIPVRMMRNDVSVGIANSRYKGIRAAAGYVIVILDSHMEVSDTWLEPLLNVLKHKPGALAVPLVHMINEKDYHKQHLNLIKPYGLQMAGGFEMMQFYYTGPPEDDVTKPYLTSSLGGGALAAYKYTLLALYPASVISSSWGIENNRLALRAWMCADGLWVPACSQILHTNGNDVSLRRYRGNSQELFKRLKEENLAEIVNFFTDSVEQRHFLSTVFSDEALFGPVLGIAESLQKTFDYSKCPRNYDWYLYNVHSSHHYKFYNTLDFVHVGEIESAYLPKLCLFVAGNKFSTESTCRKDKVFFFDTHLFAFSKNGAIHVKEGGKYCLDARSGANNSEIIPYLCHEQSFTEGVPHDPQKIAYDEDTQQIRHTPSDRCVTLVGETEGQVRLRDCEEENRRQRWFIHEPWWRRIDSGSS